MCITSTHENEELFAAKTHLLLKQKYKNLITIIIPRHVHRVNKIKNNITELGLKTVNHSENKKSLDDIDIYIVDTFGSLKILQTCNNSICWRIYF